MSCSHLIGTIIPSAVLADIGSFLPKDEIYDFGLLSPRAYCVVKTLRILNLGLVHVSKSEDGRGYVIHFDKEYMRRHQTQEEFYALLKMSRSIERLVLTNFTIDDKILNFLMEIDINQLWFKSTPVNASLPLLVKLLHPYNKKRKSVIFDSVKLFSELVNDQTLKLIDHIDISCMPNSDPHVNVTDEFLYQRNSHFKLNDFETAFTIEGISYFLDRFDAQKGFSSFGILVSKKLPEAIELYRDIVNIVNQQQRNVEYGQRKEDSSATLSCINGQGKLEFRLVNVKSDWIFQESGFAEYLMSLNVNDMVLSGTLDLPHDVIDRVTQQSFIKFNKILTDPYESSEPETFKLKELSFEKSQNDPGYLVIKYSSTYYESKQISLSRSDLKDGEMPNIIAGILKNCISIEKLDLGNKVLNEDFYQLLKPIAGSILVQELTSSIFDICLKSETFEELLRASDGLFSLIDIPNSKYTSEKLLPYKVLILYLKRKFDIDVSCLCLQHTSTRLNTWLTDEFLKMFCLKSPDFPEKFSLKSYPTTYTAEGIKDFIENLSQNSKRYDSYHLGTIDISELDSMELLVAKYEQNKDWEVTRTIESRNGKKYCTVVIKEREEHSNSTVLHVEFDLPMRAEE